MLERNGESCQQEHAKPKWNPPARTTDRISVRNPP